MRLKYLLFSIVLFFNLNLFSNTNKMILNKEEVNCLKNNPMVKVAIMNYWNHDGVGNTIHTDYLKLLNKYSDLNIVPVRYDTWKEGYSEAISKNNILHGIMNLAWSKEREEKYFDYSKAYIFEPSYLIVRKNNTDIINLKDLENKTVLSKEKSITDNIIKDISSNIKIVPIESDSMMYDRIYNDKKIDAFIAYKKYDKLLEKYNLKVVKTIYDKYSASSIGVNKKHLHLKSIINKAYKKIPKDELSNLQNKVYNDTKPYKVKNIINKKISFSKEELEYLRNNPTIKVHNESDWAPYNYNKDGVALGFSIDYMNLLASKVDINVEYISNNTWNQFLEKIKNREIDVMLNIAKTTDREKFLNFTTPYLKAIDAVFVNNDSNEYKSLKDFNGKKIAVVKGFYEAELLRKYYPKIELIELSDSLEALKAVAFGKAEATINSFGVANYLINQYNISNLKPAFEVDDDRFSLDLHIATNKNNTILRDILEKGKQVITQENILELKRKWISIKKPLENKIKLNMTLSELNYLKEKKEITYCADPDWLPFENVINGKHGGISADYVNIIEKQLGITFKLIKTKSWLESLEYAQQRKCDILSFVAMETKKRKEYLNFTTPYLNIPLVLATKLDVTFVSDFNTLTTQSIGIPKGYAYSDILKQKYPNINIIEVENIKDGLEKVKNGKLFGYVGTIATIGHMFQTKYTGELKIAGKFDEQWKLSIAIRDDDKILLDILQKSIDSISESTHHQILNKWVAIKYEKGIDYTLVWQIALLSLLILGGIIYWNRRLSVLNRELHKTKKELEGSLEDFEYLFNNTIETIALFQDNICVDINEAGIKLFGYKDKSKIVGKNVLEFIEPNSIELAKEKLATTFIEPYELDILKEDGSVFPALVKEYDKIIKGKLTRVTSLVDLTKLKDKELELIKAKNIAIQATQAKSNFLSNISHEIRTPMNAIIGMTYIVQKTALDEKQKIYMDKISLASNSLLRLINDILDFSKIEAGMLTIVKLDFNLKTVLNDVQNIASIAVKDKKLDFKIKYDKNLPLNLCGDNLRISQVLINLVSNAIKFTKEGKVELLIEQIKTNRFRFTVSDTGIGLSKDKIKNLFNLFTQADDSITRKFGGTGLGLAISKQLVELMNGKIWVESELDIGSKFIFEIELNESGTYIEEDENLNENIINQNIKIEKATISKEEVDKLFEKLKVVILKRRPNLCKPIIEELDKYNLNNDTELFANVKKLFKKYKFNEITEILNER